MQTVLALPGIARRWSGLVTLIALSTTVTLVRWSTIPSMRLGIGGAYAVPSSFYMLHPHLGWDYYGFLMNGHGSLSPRAPRPSGDVDWALAGAGVTGEDQRQDVYDSAAIELAWGRRAEEKTTPRPPTVSVSEKSDSRREGQSAQLSGALKDSFPDAVSYPATRLGDSVSRLESRQFDRLMPYASPPRPGSAPRVPTGEWRESEHQRFLANVLPGARFLSVRWRPTGAEYAHDANVAYLNGKAYRLDDLNCLLRDAGFTFDSAQMTTVAKTAVLFASFGKPRDDSGKLAPMSVTLPPSQGFPAITFLSVKRGERRYRSGYVAQGIVVDCTIDGVRNKVFVKFDGPDSLGRAAPDRVMGVGLDFRMTPLILPSLPPVRRGELPGGPTPAYGWTLGISGDTWSENDGSVDHFFIVADTNGSSTGHSVMFKVTGFGQDSVFIHVEQAQNSAVVFDSVAAVTGDTARLTWTPSYDVTAEYSVDARASRTGPRQAGPFLVDPEAWKTSILDSGSKTAIVHYMKPNDDSSGTGQFDLSQTLAATVEALQTAWNAEAPWISPDYPISTDHDTLHLAIARHRLGSPLGIADCRLQIPRNRTWDLGLGV